MNLKDLKIALRAIFQISSSIDLLIYGPSKRQISTSLFRKTRLVRRMWLVSLLFLLEGGLLVGCSDSNSESSRITFSCFEYGADDEITGYREKNSSGEACLTDIVIPEKVTKIANEAFKNKGLTSVTLSSTLTDIGNFAFQDNALTSLFFPEKLKSIGEGAFSGNSLRSLDLNSNLIIIKSQAFKDNNLESVDIPDSVTIIYGRSF